MERVYPENQWVTPCELFKPYYGYTVANYMLNQLEDSKRTTRKQLRVIEIGPGTGTFADSVLEFYKNYNLDMYREAEYVFVEISPQLAEECENIMRQKHKELFNNNRIKIYNGSILDFTKKIPHHCFVVSLEVLDNMPHDRLYFDESNPDKLKYQTVVKVKHDQDKELLQEDKVEITDQLCMQFADLYQSMPKMDHIAANKVIRQEGFFKRVQDIFQTLKYKDTLTNNIFAPTATLRMLKHISDYIPDHSLIMADFDSFIYPKNSIRGLNAPLVTNKLKDPTKWDTYDSYLIKRGEGDICFPVDFQFLKHAYQKISGYNAHVHKTSEFVDLYALQSWCNTQNMYNPMREEYFNTSFIVTDRTAQKK